MQVWGQSATPDNEKLPKNLEKEGENRKIRGKRGEIGKKRQKSRRFPPPGGGGFWYTGMLKGFEVNFVISMAGLSSHTQCAQFAELGEFWKI